MGRLSAITFAGDTVECTALERIFLDLVYSRLLDVVDGMSDMMRRYIPKERMFAPQLPEQADAREIVFHFKIQISPSIKKRSCVPSETRWVTWFACSILFDDSVFDDELARKQMSANFEAWAQITCAH